MAGSKRKRKSKHRGNAAGVVEARGRTGRKPTEDERKAKGSGKSGGNKNQPRANRLDNPPSWKSAAARAVLAAAAFFGFLVLLFKRPVAPSAVIAFVMIGVYTPLGYYTDVFLHRRRKRRLTERKSK